MNVAFLDEASHWLLRATAEASVLVLAVLALRALLGRRLSPAWRVALWVLVVAKLVLPACIPAGFGLGGWHLAGQPAAQEQTVLSQDQAVRSTAVDPAKEGNFQASAVKGSEALVVAPAGTLQSWLMWLAGTWLTGGLALLLVAGIRQARFMKEVRRRPVATQPGLLKQVSHLRRLAGVRTSIEVRVMPVGTTPAITGVLRPVLLLPENWQAHFDETRLRHVLLHEIFHVRHHDLVWNWIVLALQAVHWFNPLVWLAGARFQADRELRCDAAVLRLLAPQERLDYGRTLLHIQETFFAPPAMAGLAPCVRNHPALLQRITMIAQPNRTRPWLQTVFALAFGIITCYAFTTARAADEKDIPAKDRSRESERGPRPAGEESANTPRGRESGRAKEGEREGRMDGAKREGDGRPASGDRDGRDKTGPRDGDRPQTGERERGRDGDRKQTGARDGERPRTGERDGDRKKTGERDGERPRTGPRDGDGAEKGLEHKVTNKKRSNLNSSSSVKKQTGEPVAIRLIKRGEAVRVGDEEMPIGKLRGHLHHQETGNDTPYRLSAEPDVPYKSLADAMDALKDNGRWNVEVVR